MSTTILQLFVVPSAKTELTGCFSRRFGRVLTVHRHHSRVSRVSGRCDGAGGSSHWTV